MLVRHFLKAAVRIRNIGFSGRCVPVRRERLWNSRIFVQGAPARGQGYERHFSTGCFVVLRTTGVYVAGVSSHPSGFGFFFMTCR